MKQTITPIYSAHLDSIQTPVPSLSSPWNIWTLTNHTQYTDWNLPSIIQQTLTTNHTPTQPNEIEITIPQRFSDPLHLQDDLDTDNTVHDEDTLQLDQASQTFTNNFTYSTISPYHL